MAPKTGNILFLQFIPLSGYPPLMNLIRQVAYRSDPSILYWVQTGNIPNLPVDLKPFLLSSIRNPEGKFARLLQKMRYAAHAIYQLYKLKPKMIVVSDPMTAWVGCIIRPLYAGCLVYIEYDSPALHGLRQQKLVIPRNFLARKADAVFVPNETRKQELRRTLGGKTNIGILMNFPMKAEVIACKTINEPGEESTTLRLLYQGSLVPERIPDQLLVALSRMADVHLTIMGIRTIPDDGFHRHLDERIRHLKLSDRVFLHEPVEPLELKDIAAKHHAGIAFFSNNIDDQNLQTMWGASNKIYQYMAYGLVVLYATKEQEMIDQMDGFGIRCNMHDVDDIIDKIQYIRKNEAKIAIITEKCQQQILTLWNFENQFRDTIEKLCK